MANGIYVNNEQSAKIIHLLKSNPVMPEQELIDLIIKQSRVDISVAQPYVQSWRYCHNEDGSIRRGKEGRNAITTIHKAVKAQGFDVEAAIMGSAQPIKTKSKATAAPVPNIEGGGKIEKILAMHDAGNSNDQIIAAGFNKSTVYRQVSEYKKRKLALKAQQN